MKKTAALGCSAKICRNSCSEKMLPSTFIPYRSLFLSNSINIYVKKFLHWVIAIPGVRRCSFAGMTMRHSPSFVAGTTSWTCASSARPTRPAPPVRSARWLGACATMPFTSIASPAGSKLDRSPSFPICLHYFSMYCTVHRLSDELFLTFFLLWGGGKLQSGEKNWNASLHEILFLSGLPLKIMWTHF